MKTYLFLFSLAVLLAACKNTPNYDATSFIEMKKDPCFGACPVYEFRVDGKGDATFHGKSFTSKEGTWKRTLTPEETATLFEAFEASNFFEAFRDEYTAEVTDLPTTYLTFSHGGKSKTIKDYFGAPEALKNL
ncbi:MAG: DUF6438 domain-containing protein, partial [Bacteroidota bacterium]